MQVEPSDAARAIRAGEAPPNLVVRGSLVLRNDPHLTHLPDGLRVTQRLDLSNCTALVSLPEGLSAGALVVRGCVALEALPEGLSVSFLDAVGCRELASWPERGRVAHGHVLLRDCAALGGLPPWLKQVAQLDLAGCAGISSLDDGLEVRSFIDVAATGLRALPRSLDGVELRWRGVRIDRRIAFDPEGIAPSEILGESNAERRRVMLERVGYERFLSAMNPEILDEDFDPGGPRKLLRIPLEGDEPLVCLMVQCPSTGRRYALRVPPTMGKCRQAAAWMAGFDDPDAYAPVVET